jgi:hypothetical protein
LVCKVIDGNSTQYKKTTPNDVMYDNMDKYINGELVDKDKKKHAEVVEVKPSNHTLLEKVGKSRYNQEQYVKNMAKWEAANKWCKQQGIKFRVVGEDEIFHQGGKRK